MAVSVLTDEEKFLFDLQGFVVIKRVLSESRCQELVQLADNVWPRTDEDGPGRRTSHVSQWGPEFLT